MLSRQMGNGPYSCARSRRRWFSDSKTHYNHLLDLNLPLKATNASNVVDSPQTPNVGDEYRDPVCVCVFLINFF